MNNTVVYKERKTYTKYDNEQYLLYLNEQQAVFTEQESETKYPGWSYTGEMSDGGTLIKASELNDENKRSKFVSGLIATRYSIDDQLAILANGKDTEEHQSEFSAFEQFRADCKSEVDQMLTR